MRATLEKEEIKEIQTRLTEMQKNKMGIIMLLLEPGFITLELISENEETKKEKLKITHKAVQKIIQIIKKQQIPALKKGFSSEIKTLLGNELSTCDDLLKTESVSRTLSLLHELKDRTVMTTVEINQIRKEKK